MLANYMMEFERLDDSRCSFWCKCLLSLCCLIIGLPIYLIYYYHFSNRAKSVRAIQALVNVLNNIPNDEGSSLMNDSYMHALDRDNSTPNDLFLAKIALIRHEINDTKLILAGQYKNGV